MIITDKDTADDAKYHLMRENPPEPTKASECRDFFPISTASHGNIRICKFHEKTVHCFCENMIKYGECPKGIREM